MNQTWKDSAPGTQEKVLLDRELEEYRRNPDAGCSWEKVEAHFRSQPRL